MRLYIFRSETSPSLQAFADDESGEKLPSQFAPWHVTGVITEAKRPPFSLSREHIEGAIRERGFQLWRVKAPSAPRV